MNRFYFYALIGMILAALVGPLVKLIGNDVHFMTIIFYRVFIAFIIVAIIVPFVDKKTFVLRKGDIKEYLLVGFLITLSLGSFVVANVFAPVQNTVLISSLSPFFVLVFGFFILKEKITVTKVVSLIIALIGLSIINPFKVGSYFLGNVLALSNALFYGLLVVYMRKEDKKHGVGDVFWFLLFATILLLPFPFIFGFGDLSRVLPFILILGAFSTGIRFIFANLALEKIEAEIYSIMGIIIIPLIAILLAVFVVNEGLNSRVVLGGSILILAAIYLESHVLRTKK